MLVAIYGGALAIAGGQLAALGGTRYYLLAGVGTAAAGLLVSAGRRLGLLVYLAVLLGSLAWAFAEAGLEPWRLAPRLAAPIVIGVLAAVPWLLRLRWRALRRALAALALAGVALAAAASFHTGAPRASDAVSQGDPAAAGDWSSFANGNDGLRYSTVAQITPANVTRLQLAWTYRTGEDPARRPNPRNLPSFQATPIKIGPTLYFCTPRNQVIAVDAESGRERWRHDPHTDVSGSSYLLACRGVSYFEGKSKDEDCARRIIAGTADGRLLALDARTGRLCKGFGEDGTVSLRRHLGPSPPGYYSITSAPLVAENVIVVGAMVLDNQGRDVPSGVIRAYDAESGRQRWAFDTGADEPTESGEPPAGRLYTRGSPNAWAPFSADAALGLVYLPTGNASPDYFGRERSAAMERHASAVLALELHTGRLRWAFQTVHHDLWDYDVAAQPLLLDLPTPEGLVPALIQPTKRGDLFVLDRRSGRPLAAVEERSVPRGAVPGERLSATQPVSIGMPFLGPDERTEASLWGVTPFDHIWCRIRFRELRYEGPFTPPSLKGTLQSPSQTGASNWGRVSIDRERGILVANTVNLDSIVQLLPRAEAQQRAAAGPLFPQLGTPYASSFRPFLSPLGIPCNAPPWGELRAIDLASRQTLWRRPFGTVRDRLPLPLAFELGMPSVGGPLTTASGLTFIGAADDGYLRAYETRTGRELWSTRLPASAQAAPMTYVSQASGRQFLVIAAGGDARLGTRLGDYLVAFALPDSSADRALIRSPR